MLHLIFGFASCLCGWRWHILGYPTGVNKPYLLLFVLYCLSLLSVGFSDVCYKSLSPLVPRWCVPTRPCPTRWASWQSSTASTPTSSWRTTALRGSTALRSNCGVSSRSTSPFRRSTHVSSLYEPVVHTWRAGRLAKNKRRRFLMTQRVITA